MSVFEYVFSLYSLLLGLALAHLLSGLAKVVEAPGKVHLGFPTALLALVMMSSLTISWEIAWRARDGNQSLDLPPDLIDVVVHMHYISAHDSNGTSSHR